MLTMPFKNEFPTLFFVHVLKTKFQTAEIMKYAYKKVFYALPCPCEILQA